MSSIVIRAPNAMLIRALDAHDAPDFFHRAYLHIPCYYAREKDDGDKDDGDKDGKVPP